MRELSLREIQLAELDILVEFDRICKLNNLKYSLAAGTLLGAVRHKGFIPWDDDIDVCMPRPDYEKFIDIFIGSADKEKFTLTSDKKYEFYPFVKMLNKSFLVKEDGFKEVSHVWIDIFPMDGLPNEQKKIIKVFSKAKLYRSLIIVDKYESLKFYSSQFRIPKFLLAKLCAKRVFKSLKNLTKKYPYNEAKFIGNIIWGCYGTGEKVLKTEFLNTGVLEFEGFKFCVMGGWDKHLQAIYGDYMQLPPENKRQTHHIKAYVQE